jgi:hypothetical protein
MAWVPVLDDMVMETRLDRLGVDATANNIIPNRSRDCRILSANRAKAV